MSGSVKADFLATLMAPAAGMKFYRAIMRTPDGVLRGTAFYSWDVLQMVIEEATAGGAVFIRTEEMLK